MVKARLTYMPMGNRISIPGSTVILKGNLRGNKHQRPTWHIKPQTTVLRQLIVIAIPYGNNGCPQHKLELTTESSSMTGVQYPVWPEDDGTDRPINPYSPV